MSSKMKSIFVTLLYIISCAKAADEELTTVCNKCHCQKSMIPYLVDCTHMDLNYMIHANIPYQDGDSFADDQSKVFELDYSNNNIREIFRLATANIVSISFHNNKIDRIEPIAFKNLSMFHFLDLSNNYLDADSFNISTFEGPYDIKGFLPSPLVELNLAHNHIREIEGTSFEHLTRLEVLNLDHNPISALGTQIQKALSSLVSLKVLSLSNTGLTTLPENFLSSFHDLTTLTLSDNIMTSVPEDIKHMSALQELRLDGNHFKILDGNSFDGLNNLERLYLNNLHMLLKIEENAFGTIPKLQILSISNCSGLTFIHPDSFEGIYPENFKLRQLHLSHNKLKYLPSRLVPEATTNWKDLEVIDLQWNPWACNCHNDWMLTNLLQQIMDNTPKLTENFKCGGPGYLTGLSFTEVSLNADQLPCDPRDNFDPYQTNFGISPLAYKGYKAPKSDDDHPADRLALGVAILCFIAIILSACFVGGLYLRKQRQLHYRTLHNVRFERSLSEMSTGSSEVNMGQGRTIIERGLSNHEDIVRHQQP